MNFQSIDNKNIIKIILFTIIILLSFNSNYNFAEEPECESCETKPSKECCDQTPWLSICDRPANDTPDDNFSYSEGNINDTIYFYMPDALIYREGEFEIYKNFINKDKDKGVAFANLDVNASTLIKSGKLLILPTGALIGKENDSTLKYILDEYVKLGGTIIVFAQQHGDDFDKVVPIPDGEILKSYGWREDQSCLRNSAYFNINHPVVSSSTKQLIDAGIDGYFEKIPSNSTVYLTRRKNRDPVLISYPYGENGGKVILTTLYSDWAFAHSQATVRELRIVRDLVTWAKDPNTEIPMFNLADNSSPEIALNINIKNDLELDIENVSTTTATKAKIYVYTPCICMCQSKNREFCFFC